MSTRMFEAVHWKEGDMFCIFVPELGVITQAETEQEILPMVTDLLEISLQSIQEGYSVGYHGEDPEGKEPWGKAEITRFQVMIPVPKMLEQHLCKRCNKNQANPLGASGFCNECRK